MRSGLRKWWEELLRWFRERFGGRSDTWGTLSVRDELPAPILALSRGGVFDFAAHVVLTWVATGLSELDLHDAIQYHRAGMQACLSELVARRACQHEPYDAYTLERELTKELDGTKFHFEWVGVDLLCQPLLRVRPDQKVREKLGEPLLARAKMECEHEVGMRRAVLVDQLARRWSDVLTKLWQDPFVEYAAKLTDKDLAQVVDQLIENRGAESASLLALLRQAINDHNSLGIGGYEWAESLEAALRSRADRHDPGARQKESRMNGHGVH